MTKFMNEIKRAWNWPNLCYYFLVVMLVSNRSQIENIGMVPHTHYTATSQGYFHPYSHSAPCMYSVMQVYFPFFI